MTSIKTAAALVALTMLASCGPQARGEIGQACAASDRSAANPALCNCIQAVANQTLGASDQALVKTFFEDAEIANDIKISDTTSADAFWERYRRFTDAAQRSCR